MRGAARLGRLVLNYGRREEGVSAALVAMFLIPIIGMAGMAMDVARAYQVQRWLQNSADNTALAGAAYVNDGVQGDAFTKAAKYAVNVSSDYNANSAYSGTSVSYTPTLKCYASLTIQCGATGSDASANAIQVRMTAVVPMYFAGVLGVKTMTVATVATAQEGGFKNRPYNIEFIIDTTHSMTGSDSKCSIANATRETCAQAGMKAFLGLMDPTVDTVGLLVFPELATPGDATKDTACPTSNPNIASYTALSTHEGGSVVASSDSTYPTYEVVAPENTYETSYGSGVVTTDALGIAVGASAVSNCSGLQAPGGAGTFYADSITQAQYILNNLKTSGTVVQKQAQNVIIILSDGDANSGNIYSAAASNQCDEAYTAAQTAKTAGTWIYSLSYGSSTSAPTGSCATDSSSTKLNGSTISACVTMENLASNASKFYADDASGCTSSDNTTLTDMIAVFKSVASSLQRPRLIPNNTT